MTTDFTYLFETRSQVVNHLHFISCVVSSITVRRDCLIEFEKYKSLVSQSLIYLRQGLLDSLTFGFRVIGFDYASSNNYISNYRKDKGDIVVKLVCTFHDGTYRLEYSSHINK